MKAPLRVNLIYCLVFCMSVLLDTCGLGSVIFGQSLTYVPVITPFAGSTTACSTATDSIGDGCKATEAILAQPFGSVADRQGNLYFSDYGHNVVRRIDARTGVVTTVVGIASGSSATVCSAATDTVGDGCPATEATVKQPMGLTFDPFGNLVIADYGNHRVRMVNQQTGVIASLVGTGIAATAVPSNSSPGTAESTQIGMPSFLVFDQSGNLYITTQSTQSVTLVVAVDGKITPSASLVYNLAGTGTAGNSGDGGVATQAQFYTPRALNIDASGNILVGSYTSCVVRKITSPFQGGTLNLAGTTVTRIVGNGTCSTTISNGGQATGTSFQSIESTALDNSGNLYIAQYHAPGDAVRSVNLASGIVSSFAGAGSRASSITASNGNGGPAVNALLDGPTGISFGPYGESFISGYINQTIRRVSLDNLFGLQAVGNSSNSQNVVVQATDSLTLKSAAISPSAGTTFEFKIGTLSGCSVGGSLASNAYCTIPLQFAPSLPGLRSSRLVLSDGDSVTSTIGLTGIGVAPFIGLDSGAISTVAGNGTPGYSSPPAQASAAEVNSPRGGSMDAAGNLYFADSGNHVIRKISADGMISTIAGNGMSGYSGDGGAATSATLNSPAKVQVDAAGNLYIVDTGNSVIRYVSVDTGTISTIAGTGSAGYSGDSGLATAATFNQPQGIAVDRGGNIYVADSGNHAIRYFTIGGYIRTFAGTGAAGYSSDNIPATSAQLNTPVAVTVDTDNNLYIADSGNGVIRVVSATGQIKTVAGSTNASANSGDGGSATSASLVLPSDIAVDAAGELYIASGGVVRLVNTAGVISTVVGKEGGTSYSGEGGLATAATLGSTQLNLMLDGNFNLYISDTSSHRILLANEANSMELAFGKQTPGTTGAARSIVVRNTGNSDLNITNIVVQNNFVEQGGSTTACTATTVLPAGSACTVNVAFSPQAGTQGTLSGSIVITDNALNNPISTHEIKLTGEAQDIASTTTTVSITPSTLTYGNTAGAVATAVVDGSNSPTGTVVFSVNGTTLGSMTLASGSASIQLPNLQAGTFPVTASYLGDGDNASSYGSINVVVQPATLTVTATDVSIPQGGTLPTLTYTIAGFVGGDTASVVSGAPVESTTATSSSAAGTYPITLLLGTLTAANYTFNLVSGTLTVLPPPSPDFSLSISPQTLTVTAGKVGSVTVSMTELYSYTGTAQLSCSDLPANVVCHFALSTLTGDPSATNGISQVKLSIATDNIEQLISQNHAERRRLGLTSLNSGISLSMFVGMVLLVPAKTRKLRNLIGVLLLAIGITSLTGCSENLGSRVAALGTSHITVNATDATNKITHSQTFTLVVQ